MHKKPTNPFGHIIIREGGVDEKVYKLPKIKEDQEQTVIDLFTLGYNKKNNIKISDITPLEENNHDFLVKVGELDVVVQLTEIIERDYVIDKNTKYEPKPNGGICFRFGLKPRNVDFLKYNQSIKVAIERKISKHYSKPKEEFWLIVFTIDNGFFSISDENQDKIQSPIKIAQKYLNDINPVFDKIWLFNLYFENPVIIWKIENSN